MAGYNGIMAGSPYGGASYGGGQSIESYFYKKFWICPRCGLVYARAHMDKAACCKFCWTKEDQIALEAKKEDVRKQLQEIDKELEEYHRNKLKDRI